MEIGPGAGENFTFYPPSVTEVVAVEPEPYFRDLALRAAASVPISVTILSGMAEQLPGSNGEFDAVVATRVLCSVVSVPTALAEIRRVLRPDGKYHFWEHIRAEGRLGRVQSALDATVWPTLMGGCHSGRETLLEIRRSGFRVEWDEHFVFPDTGVRSPTGSHVMGVATAST